MCNCEECSKCVEVKRYDFPLITSVFLILTEQCNLACTYCFVNQNPKQMTLDIAKQSVDFIINNAKLSGVNPSVNFFGGEPMIKFEEIIKPLISYVETEHPTIKMKWSITSNGTLFTKEILDYFKQKEVGILLSLDGCQQSNDTNRIYHDGRGSFNRINEILDYYLELNPLSTLRTTIERNTVQYFLDNIMFGISKPFSNIFFIPNSFVVWSEEDKLALKEQVRMFADMFIEYCRNGKIIPLSPFEEKIRSIVKINKAIDTPMVKNYRVKCGLGGNRFASVGTDGTLYGCQEMTSNNVDDVFVIGDIYNGAREDLRANLVEKFRVDELCTEEKCKTCKLQPVCTGGCVANNYMQTGSMTKQADIICFWEQILLNEAIRVCNILGEEKNELFRQTYFSKQ